MYRTQDESIPYFRRLIGLYLEELRCRNSIEISDKIPVDSPKFSGEIRLGQLAWIIAIWEKKIKDFSSIDWEDRGIRDRVTVLQQTLFKKTKDNEKGIIKWDVVYDMEGDLVPEYWITVEAGMRLLNSYRIFQSDESIEREIEKKNVDIFLPTFPHKKKDTFAEVIYVVASKYIQLNKGFPTPKQLWECIYKNPPDDYGLERGKNSLIKDGNKLNWKLFIKRFKRYSKLASQI